MTTIDPTAGEPRGRTAFGVKALLSAMMFLQYAVWGVWLPYLAIYLSGSREAGGLGFSGAQVGYILGIAGAIGAVAAPFLAGQIADRFINAERYLGILLILGGAANFGLFYATTFGTFLALSVVYSVLYMPTLALTNSIAFAHLRDAEGEFPPVRTFGTLGWIVATNLFPLVGVATVLGIGWIPQNPEGAESFRYWIPPFFQVTNPDNAAGLIANALRVSGAISVLYGLFAILFLPRTPPTRSVEHPLAFLRAFRFFVTKPGLLAVTIAALPIAMVHQVYFIRTAPFFTTIGFAEAQAGPLMSIGQFSELLFLALLGFFLKRLGFKWIITLGALAFAARFACFAGAASGQEWLVFPGLGVHGICYGFFFAASFLYVERVVPQDVRHSAQTAFGIVILGLGPVLASFYNQWLDTVGSSDPAAGGAALFRYAPVWWIQSGIAAATALALASFFRADTPAGADAAPRQAVSD